ncbi:protein-L-isoaspartate O-methyltransferase [Streptomyces sp. SP17BM10]|uniref:methyltransferase domain-containing protein n=1 Tax=Streptomyces sp. SP17BM10 TaxID=3002530 RepID=UPI002E760806|nr:methyltransferase domain-containing protein [Streptomyces sp. SP17BM10]MEE1784144.1 protein-L-isoaspartate O-methyltransferase [Streptomyces sp. SP17BM10]
MDEYVQLLADLTEAGALGEEWRGAFERAPRSAFIPDTVWAPDDDAPTGYERVTKADAPDAWWSLVNTDGVVVTQVDDGRADGPGIATSSASMPSLVATMLRHLDVRDGHKVLDVGTGTGWTSALLCGRLGDDRVTTVEVDPAIAAEAALRLAAAGFAPERVVGDGLAGWSCAAPYDRIHSTAAVRRVPSAWIEQTRPGGIIVTPWGTPYANAGLLHLMVGRPGEPSHGRFVANVSFMWMRAQRPHAVVEPVGVSDHRGPSAMDPELALEDVNAAFAIGLRVPGVRYEHVWDDADPSGTYRMQLSDGAGSWASVRHTAWDAEDAVHQSGARRLWDEITSARLWWLEEGKPDLHRFGVTIALDGAQSVWLDDSGNPVA